MGDTFILDVVVFFEGGGEEGNRRARKSSVLERSTGHGSLPLLCLCVLWFLRRPVNMFPNILWKGGCICTAIAVNHRVRT